MNWLESNYLYLGLMVFSLSYPLAQSFEWRLKLYAQWRSIFKGIIVMSVIFIPWDVWFTYKGVWWFSDQYILGIKVFHLPLEEWLFFLIVPYACVFIYEVLNYYIKRDYLKKIAPPFFLVLGVILISYSCVYYSNLYTSITFSLTGLASLLLVWKRPHWMGRFLFAYLISWLPFLLINGALTGNFTKYPVVNYNATEIIGFRLTTIPIEDSMYNLLMLLIVVSVYEKNKEMKPL